MNPRTRRGPNHQERINLNQLDRKPLIIGELMNNSYGRARRSWKNRDLEGYRELAALQAGLGASFLTLNLDGTKTLAVSLEEMLEFLPKVIPAIQEATSLPLSFDNPDIAFHREALRHFDLSGCEGRPILNSLAASRHDIDGMIELAAKYDMDIIVMASECYDEKGGHRAARSPEDVRDTALYFVELVRRETGFSNDRLIVDPGLSPIASDTAGGVNLCLDALRTLRECPELEGIHLSVGLSNFSIGSPGPLRIPLERAFLRLALDAGLDYALANPEKNTLPLPGDDPLVTKLLNVLVEGRPASDEDMEEAGYRQLDAFMELWKEPVNPA